MAEYQTAAGALPAGMTPLEGIVQECKEEADPVVHPPDTHADLVCRMARPGDRPEVAG